MPKIYMTPKVNAQIEHLVAECPTEINGIGRVSPLGDDFLIDEIAVLKQEATAASVMVDTEDFANFIAHREDAHLWRLQWHSHANMGVFWSMQDEDAIETIGETAEWLISIVTNKQGQFLCRLDVFNVEATVPERIRNFFPGLAKHQKLLSIPLEVFYEVEDFTEWAKAEIAQKVSHRAGVEIKKNTYIGPVRYSQSFQSRAAGGQEVPPTGETESPGSGSVIILPSEGGLSPDEEDLLDDLYDRQRQRDESFTSLLHPPLHCSIEQKKQIIAAMYDCTVKELERDYADELIDNIYEEMLDSYYGGHRIN